MRSTLLTGTLLRSLFAVVAFAGITSSAHAIVTTCNTTFVDVPPDANYCQAAEWLKQRGVTLGCTDATHYCPNDVVTRASMALFLRRLSDVAAPVFAHATQFVTLSSSTYLCQTSDIGIGTYARIASGNGVAYIISSGTATNASAQLAYSLDGGVNWGNLAAAPMSFSVGTTAGSSATGHSVASPKPFAGGQTVRFGLFVTTNSTVNSSCELTVRLDNFNGAILQ